MKIGIYAPYPSMVSWFPALLCRVCRGLGCESHTTAALDACAGDDITLLLPFNNYLREEECARLKGVCGYPVLVQTEQIHLNPAYLDRFLYHQRHVAAVVETMPELMRFTAGKTNKPVVEMTMGYHESMRRLPGGGAWPVDWDVFCLDSMTDHRRPYFEALDACGIAYYRGHTYDFDQISCFAAHSRICLATHSYGPGTAMANLKVIGRFISNGGFVIAQRSDYPYLKEGRHVVYYDNPGEMIERIRHYCAHQDEARRIADRAHAHIRGAMKMEDHVRACLDAIRAAGKGAPVRTPGTAVVTAPPSAPSTRSAPLPAPPAGHTGHPRVSVVIPCYNLGNYLDKAVDSVLGQTLQDFEVIIVDDGSTDEHTRNLLSSYAGPRTAVVRIENRGPAGARNEGIRRARAPFVLCLDADDVLEPSCLEKCCRVLEEQPDVGVASFWYRAFGGQEWEFKPVSCTLTDILVENRLCGNSMFRKKAWRDVGGYDESFRTGYEDWEFWIAVLGGGYRAHIIQEILFNYRVRPDSRDIRNVVSQVRNASMEKIIAKHSDLFRAHATDVLLRKEEIFADALDYQRELLKTREWYKVREREHEDLIRNLLEAKAWYLEQIDGYKGAAARREGEVARMEGQVARMEGEVARMEGEVARQSAELDQARRTIDSRDHELRAVHGSKAWKLGCAFQDAKRSPRAALLLPFRLLDFCCPDGIKRCVGKALLIPPGEPVRRGWYKFPYRLLDRALPSSAKERIPLRLRNAARAVFRTTDARIIRQERWDGPLVSVVIPCYNYGRFLDEALASVQAQTFVNYEIIIVDDGSTDPLTIDKLREIEGRRISSVAVIRQKNQRLPSTRNNGISIAKGKYVCCLDADDVIEPTYLEKCLSVLESGNLDICYSHVRLFGDEARVWETSDFDPAVLQQQNCVCVGAVYRRSMWEKAGGYNPEMTIGYEDWDLWLSMAEKGALGKVICEPLFKYRKHGRSMIDDAQAKHGMLCAQLQKNHPILFNGKIKPARLRYKVQDPFVNVFPPEGVEPGQSRVLFMIPWMAIGGGDAILRGIAQALQSGGKTQVHIFTTDRPLPSMGDSSQEFMQVTPHVYQLPLLFDEELWCGYLEAYIRHRTIDTLFICGSRFVYPHLKRLKGLFPKLRIVDQLFNDSPMGHAANNRKYARWIDETFIAAEKLRRSILDRFGGDPARLRTIYHGADTALFDPARIDAAESRARFNLPPGKRVVLYVGRLSVEKNPLLFVELAAALKGGQDLLFVMRGNGPLRDEVAARVRELRLDNFLLLDIVPPEDVPLLYRAADLLVLTSLTEGVPLTIFEALAMNVPVAASDVGGISDVVREGVNGFLFRDGDPAGCVEKVRRALGHRFGDLRAEARERYELRDVYARYREALEFPRLA